MILTINPKGFKVIQCYARDIAGLSAEEHITLCEETDRNGYYVPVLQTWLCESCYQEWMKEAKRYPEDIDFEERNYQNCLRLIQARNVPAQQ